MNVLLLCVQSIFWTVLYLYEVKKYQLVGIFIYDYSYTYCSAISHIILPLYKLNTTPSHMMTIVKTRAILGPLRRS